MSRVELAPPVLSLALLVAIVGVGCANLGPGVRGTPCPVAWVPSDSIDPADARLRARIEFRVGGEEIHLEVITEKRPEELVVVALARFGVRLFAVRQRGVEVLVEGASTDELKRVAIWMMDALHRIYWIESPQDSTDASWNRGGEEIRETRASGLRRRVFSLTGAHDASRRVTIDYARPMANSDVSSGTVEIRNPWCGYEAAIAPIGATGSAKSD